MNTNYRKALLKILNQDRQAAPLAERIENRRRIYGNAGSTETFLSNLKSSLKWAVAIKTDAAKRNEIEEADSVVAAEVLDETVKVVAELLDLLLAVTFRVDTPTKEKMVNSVIYLLVSASDDILRASLKKRHQECIRRVARKNTTFPSVLSVFRTENRAAERFISDSLELGRDLFRLDPKRTFTHESWMAMEIVETIIRSGSASPPAGIYDTVYPGFAQVRFCKENEGKWRKLIELHMDFYQAPAGWFRPKLERMPLSEEKSRAQLIEWHKNGENWHIELENRIPSQDSLGQSSPFDRLIKRAQKFWPLRRINDIPEFRKRIDSGKDKSIKTESKLFVKMKGRIIDAAVAMMPE